MFENANKIFYLKDRNFSWHIHYTDYIETLLNHSLIKAMVNKWKNIMIVKLIVPNLYCLTSMRKVYLGSNTRLPFLHIDIVFQHSESMHRLMIMLIIMMTATCQRDAWTEVTKSYEFGISATVYLSCHYGPETMQYIFKDSFYNDLPRKRCPLYRRFFWVDTLRVPQAGDWVEWIRCMLGLKFAADLEAGLDLTGADQVWHTFDL